MFRLKSVFRSIFVRVCVVGFAPAAAFAGTNTNSCIGDFGGIQVCQATNSLGLPNDLQGCCDGVLHLVADRCECNPALDLLLGEKGKRIYELEPICRRENQATGPRQKVTTHGRYRHYHHDSD